MTTVTTEPLSECEPSTFGDMPTEDRTAAKHAVIAAQADWLVAQAAPEKTAEAAPEKASKKASKKAGAARVAALSAAISEASVELRRLAENLDAEGAASARDELASLAGLFGWLTDAMPPVSNTGE